MKLKQLLQSTLLRISSIILIVSMIAAGCTPARFLPAKGLDPRSRAHTTGRIVILTEDGNLSLAEPGKEPLKLTNDAFMPNSQGGTMLFYQFPSWTQAGDKLAFVQFQGTENQVAKITIYTCNPDGSSLEPIFSSTALVPVHLYWSPDGSQLSFLSLSPESGMLSLYLVPAAGGEPSALLENASSLFWDWSPNSSTIAVHSSQNSFQPDNQMMIMEAANAGTGIPPTGAGSLVLSQFYTPAWSPSGEDLLLAAQTTDNASSLLLYNPVQNENQVLAVLEGPVSFGWSADNEHIAFINQKEAYSGLRYGPLSVIRKSSPGKVLTTGEAVVAFFWSPDGKKIAYLEPLVLKGVLGDGTNPEDALRFRLSVLDITNGRSRDIIDFVPTGNFANILPFADQLQRSTTIWSPDSHHLVVSAEVDQSPVILIVNSHSRQQPQVLGSGLLAFWSWK